MCHGKTEVLPDKDGIDPYAVSISPAHHLQLCVAPLLQTVEVQYYCLSFTHQFFFFFIVSDCSALCCAHRSPRREASSEPSTVGTTSPLMTLSRESLQTGPQTPKFTLLLSSESLTPFVPFVFHLKMEHTYHMLLDVK